MPALDRYDDRDIDDEEVGETFEEREQARLRAEREMDRAQGVRRTRLPAALLEGGVCFCWTYSSIPGRWLCSPAAVAAPLCTGGRRAQCRRHH